MVWINVAWWFAKHVLVVRKASASGPRVRVVELTPEGKRLAASCYEEHAKDLEAALSVVMEVEKQRMYASLRKVGLFAAELANDSWSEPMREE